MDKKISWLENHDGPEGGYYKVISVKGKRIRLFARGLEIAILLSNCEGDKECVFKELDKMWDDSLKNESLEIMDYIKREKNPILSLDKSEYFVYGRVLEIKK